MGFLTRYGFDKPAPAGRGPAPGPSSIRRGAPIEAVVENLRLVLNTKEGYGWFLPGFGLGHYFASPASGALDALMRELEDNVRRFEPRIGEPRLAALGRDASWIRCRLTGSLADRPIAIAIQFDVSFGTVCVEVEGDGER